MVNLTDAPEFTANEIYEIQQTDRPEGAGSGASFSGIGISNQPHQQLANRTAFLKGRQDTNIGNISLLLAFMAEFTSSLGPNGYLKIPVTDLALGAQTLIVQWGFLSLVGQTPAAIKNALWPIAFPVAFPNAGLWAGAMWQLGSGTPTNTVGPFAGGMMAAEATPPSKTGFGIFTDWDSNASILVASGPGGNGLTGAVWFAIGY